MHGDSKALICGTSVARPCQHLVGKLCDYPAYWSSITWDEFKLAL
jgi:hypothetical protein